MMRNKFIAIKIIFISLLLLVNSKAYAQEHDQEKLDKLISEIKKTNAKLGDLESEVKNQALDKIQQQNKNLELIRAEQKNLKEGLAQDIEKFEQSSKTNFQEFAVANSKTLGKVLEQMNAQNDRLADTNSIFKAELIPAINDILQANDIKVDLANEKLSRLIEILKTIAKEQAKLGPLATALGTVQKSQANLKKNQEEIKKALADIRRKANVNISRNDDLRKTLRQLQYAIKEASKN